MAFCTAVKIITVVDGDVGLKILRNWLRRAPLALPLILSFQSALAECGAVPPPSAVLSSTSIEPSQVDAIWVAVDSYSSSIEAYKECVSDALSALPLPQSDPEQDPESFLTSAAYQAYDAQRAAQLAKLEQADAALSAQIDRYNALISSIPSD